MESNMSDDLGSHMRCEKSEISEPYILLVFEQDKENFDNS
jgi:hypothetical protein